MDRTRGRIRVIALATALLSAAGILWATFGTSSARPAESVAAPASPRLTTLAEVERGIGQARIVTISAYVLSEHSRIVDDLLKAAKRGAAVSVALPGTGMAYALRENAPTVVRLRAGGVRVHLLHELHMKAIVLDGQEIYVTDRNWAARGPALILGLPATYRLTVERAIEGRAARLGTFTTSKAESLATEGDVFAAGGPLVVQTESFGADAPQVPVLERLARAGADVELIVARSEFDASPRERAELADLAREGVRVKISSSTEKIAVGPTWAWCGSTNLSAGAQEQIDWGFATRDPGLVEALRARVLATAATRSHAAY